jgi:hypothetical protein
VAIDLCRTLLGILQITLTLRTARSEGRAREVPSASNERKQMTQYFEGQAVEIWYGPGTPWHKAIVVAPKKLHPDGVFEVQLQDGARLAFNTAHIRSVASESMTQV